MFPAGGGPRSLAIADLDADGIPDLAVANKTSDDVSVLPGNGDGTFQAQLTFPAGNDPRSVAIADLDADGIPDLATANEDCDDVSVLLNQCDVAGCPADVNGDGELDILDFAAFQSAFAAGDPKADFFADGKLDIFDFVAFQSAFQAGCP